MTTDSTRLMKSILHRMVFLVLVVLSVLGCSGADDQTGDREGNFPIINSGYWVAYTGGGSTGTIFWLDDNRVVFIGYDPDNTEAEDQPQATSKMMKQHIFVWDVDANEVERYKRVPHGAQLFFHDGIFKYGGRIEGKLYWWRGPFGKEQRYEGIPFKYRRGFHLRGREENREGMPSLSQAHIYIPLRVEHGYIDRGPPTSYYRHKKKPIDDFYEYPLVLYPRYDAPGIPLIRPPSLQGERVQLMNKDIGPIRATYADFAKTYVFWLGNRVIRLKPEEPLSVVYKGSRQWYEMKPSFPVFTIEPDGHVGEVHAPFREWQSSTSLTRLTKRGLLLMSRSIKIRKSYRQKKASAMLGCIY